MHQLEVCDRQMAVNSIDCAPLMCHRWAATTWKRRQGVWSERMEANVNQTQRPGTKNGRTANRVSEPASLFGGEDGEHNWSSSGERQQPFQGNAANGQSCKPTFRHEPGNSRMSNKGQKTFILQFIFSFFFVYLFHCVSSECAPTSSSGSRPRSRSGSQKSGGAFLAAVPLTETVRLPKRRAEKRSVAAGSSKSIL